MVKSNRSEGSRGVSELNDWPGGLSRDEWLDYWRAGNVTYKADDLCIDDLRNDLAFAVEQINSLPSLVEALKEARELIEPIATNWSDDARVQAAKAIEVINEALKGTPQ
jgi:hypothetical protein